MIRKKNLTQQINEVRNRNKQKMKYRINVKCKPLFIVDVHLSDLHAHKYWIANI